MTDYHIVLLRAVSCDRVDSNGKKRDFDKILRTSWQALRVQRRSFHIVSLPHCLEKEVKNLMWIMACIFFIRRTHDGVLTLNWGDDSCESRTWPNNPAGLSICWTCFLAVRAIWQWNPLPWVVMDSVFLGAFKQGLDVCLLLRIPYISRGLDSVIFGVICSSVGLWFYSYILCTNHWITFPITVLMCKM